MIKVNVSAPLVDRLGENFVSEGKITTVGEILNRMLDATLEMDKADKFADKMVKWNLMKRIEDAQTALEPLELDAHEVVMLSDRLALAGFSTTVVGRVGDALAG